MKIALLLSGGVDSSVALSLLRQQGYQDITAFYLKIWLEDELAFLGECPWEDDLAYARAVCEQWNVPLEVVSMQGAYWENVVAQVVQELKAGRTPSPDILCNQRVKFGAFTQYIDDSFDKIASGHYATVMERDGQSWLLQGVDPIKDQTYFLSYLSQKQLARCLFPIGMYPKIKVRALAEEFALANRSRPDSQGICFLGKIKYSDFVKYHLGERRGEIREIGTERVLGEHKGFWFHTIGQRKGLGLGGGPWFVVDKHISKNIIYVSSSMSAAERARTDFNIRSVNWLSGAPQTEHLRVKIRHGERMVPCTIVAQGDEYAVSMAEADKGVAPGQYAVLYDGNICLGGGIISH